MAGKSKKTETLVLDVLSLLQIQADIVVEEEEEQIAISLSTEDSGIVIGHHGDVLEALQLFLSLAIAKKTGEFKRVSLDIGDYKKNRIAYLEQLANQTKEKVLSSGQEYSLASLKPWERRVVHLSLQHDDEVVSESVGEGRDRTLIIKPR